jgi:hypothetical protein
MYDTCEVPDGPHAAARHARIAPKNALTPRIRKSTIYWKHKTILHNA